jgi:hypothetical protein
VRRVSPGAEIGDAITRFYIGNALADSLHRAGPFGTLHEGQFHRIEPGAVIGVDEIEAGGRLFDQRFAGARLAWFEMLHLQHVRAAGFVHDDPVRLVHVSVLQLLAPVSAPEC